MPNHKFVPHKVYSFDFLKGHFGVNQDEKRRGIAKYKDDRIAFVHLDPAKNINVDEKFERLVICGVKGTYRDQDREAVKSYQSPRETFPVFKQVGVDLYFIGDYYCVRSLIQSDLLFLYSWMLGDNVEESLSEIVYLQRSPANQIQRSHETYQQIFLPEDLLAGLDELVQKLGLSKN